VFLTYLNMVEDFGLLMFFLLLLFQERLWENFRGYLYLNNGFHSQDIHLPSYYPL